MSAAAALLLAILATSLVPAIAIFFLADTSRRKRTALNLVGSTANLALVGFLAFRVYHHHVYSVRCSLGPGFDLVLHADALSLLFLLLSSALWFLTTLYAIGYMEGTPNVSRFFGFFSLCVSASVGIALAGNLITFLVFYELLTMATYPLVVHHGNAAAIEAGRTYLAYTLSGGVLLFVAIVWLGTLGGNLDFAAQGFVSGLHADSTSLVCIFALMIAGLGVKAALVPLHGWLPVAMVAPAPVSALLHAVAVVKAGAFGIARVVFDVYGVRFAGKLGVLRPLAMLAAISIVYASVRALFEDNLKRRLAYSTVSQVAYITLGVATVGPIASIGGLVHLVHQGLMKITLFFCAGNLVDTLDMHNVSEMSGVGRRMPWTMAAFTIGAFGMIGVPPVAGFVSKWYLATGSAEAGAYWVIGVLLLSSVLNAAYFLPIVYRAWFGVPDSQRSEASQVRSRDAGWLLLLPTITTAIFSLVVGLFAAAPISPLGWVQLIVAREYGP